MSTTKDAAATAGTAAKARGGGEGGKETKLVETVDYRSSAGHAPGETEKKQVEVVHEYPTGGDPAAAAGGGKNTTAGADKQD